MKIKLHLSAVLFALAAVAGRPALAQEAGLPDYEVVDPEKERLERERIINSPGEGDIRFIPKNPAPATGVARDSMAVKPQVAPPLPKAKNEQPVRQPEKPLIPKEDDSMLSFNFLYYIIQKYKLQDIID